MPEVLESVLVYILSGGVIAVLALKEFAAYRLPATHRLNELLNPQKVDWPRGTDPADWEMQGSSKD